MGMFNDLLNRIFHRGESESARSAIGTAPTISSASGESATAVPSPSTPVDIEQVLTSYAAQRKEKLDWRKSIVDLLKLVGMDSDLEARRRLAAELHYSGDTSDTAKMNMWLHREVMKRLAENGGKVPAELLAA